MRAFDRMLKARYKANEQTDRWKTPEEVMRWWLTAPPVPDWVMEWTDPDRTKPVSEL